MKSFKTASISALILAAAAFAGEMAKADKTDKAGHDGKAGHQHPPAPKASAELERLKGLAGVWEGKSPMMKDQPVTITYTITAGGSAVEEKIMPGTPQEMTTMYYDEGGKVQLTHYCSLGNHPTMKLSKSEPAKLHFAVVGNTEGQAMHMHALTLTTTDKDHMTADWVVYDKGAAGPTHSFILTRKKT